jgi:transglutaminase-like putative cysteine protease
MIRNPDQGLTTIANADLMGLDAYGTSTRGEKIAIVSMVAGAAAIVGGLVYYIYATRKRTNAVLGQVVNRVEAGGMTLDHHKESDMTIEQRLKILQDLTWQSVQDPRSRKLALEMTAKCPERDGECEAKAIYQAIKGRVRYTGDVAAVKQPSGEVEGIDLYQSAYRTWEFKGGDCDDNAILATTMLTLNGIQAKFRITAPKKGADFSHVYCMANLPKNNPTKWVALDTTLPGNDKFGVEVPFGKSRDFPA